jgi:ADP-heptose:LPS heptosyltransferase
VNDCGERSLAESVAEIAASDEFWGVDSGLLHYAWLLDTKSVSFWGPTDPRTRLRSTDRSQHEIYYRKVICSPCIHVAETPPCGGNNICIQGLFGGEGDPGGLVVRSAIGVEPQPPARDR